MNALHQSQPAVRGKILAVHENNQFAVLSFGKDEGLKTGHVLQVLREGKPIVDLKIILVEKNRSVGKVIDSETKSSIEKGDDVVGLELSSSEAKRE